jgi:hypothetical protein
MISLLYPLSPQLKSSVNNDVELHDVSLYKSPWSPGTFKWRKDYIVAAS